MPMMVGMMVCVMLVCTAEYHNVMRRFSREVFLYPSLSRGVNEIY